MTGSPSRSNVSAAAVVLSRQPTPAAGLSGAGATGGTFGGIALGQLDKSPQIGPVPPARLVNCGSGVRKPRPGPPGAPVLSPRDKDPAARAAQPVRSPLPEGAADMHAQQTSVAPVIVTLPAQLHAAAAEEAADRITAAFTPGVSVVIADLTATTCCDRSAIRNLLKAHRKATARGGQVRFAIRPDGPLHQITGFAGTHP